MLRREPPTAVRREASRRMVQVRRPRPWGILPEQRTEPALHLQGAGSRLRRARPLQRDRAGMYAYMPTWVVPRSAFVPWG